MNGISIFREKELRVFVFSVTKRNRQRLQMATKTEDLSSFLKEKKNFNYLFLYNKSQ